MQNDFGVCIVPLQKYKYQGKTNVFILETDVCNFYAVRKDYFRNAEDNPSHNMYTYV